MTDFFKKHFHTGYIKALLIAFPVTLLYVWLLVDLRLLSEGGIGIVLLPVVSLPALGLGGAWIAFLRQPQLDQSSGALNTVTAFLLGGGIIGAFLLLLYGILGMFIAITKLNLFKMIFIGLPLLLLIYAVFLIRRVLHLGKWKDFKIAEEEI